jgi:CcmD family protein
VIYLVTAYAFAVALLGGYLFWSLRQLRQMERRRPER